MENINMGKRGDDLGDRMKFYEMAEAGRMLLPLLPVCVRLDGKSFSRFTEGLERPYDSNFVDLMNYVTKQLVEETNACIGYTQSDEISLVLYSSTFESQIFFNGRIQKLTSVLASMATGFFNGKKRDIWLPSKEGKGPAFFDCRVWNVPNKTEAANAILWRERDASKNSIQAATRAYYSHNECFNKNTKEMNEMLFKKGVNWNDYPIFFKRGTFYQRKKIVTKFSEEEMSRLPEFHEARKNPDLEFERSVVKMVLMPPFDKVINREEVIFDGAEPIVMSE